MFDISWDLDPSKNVAQQLECDLVKHICNDVTARSSLLNALEIDDPILLASHVVQPLRRDRSRQPGDLDILICSTFSPERTIAIECKRVPVFAKDEANLKKGLYQLIDKGGRYQYRALEDGAAQIQKLYRLRFHHTYQLVIIATDGRGRWGMNQFYRHATSEVHQRIGDLRVRPSIPSGVGLITFEIAQKTEKPVQYNGSISCYVERPARPRVQSAPLTAKVDRLLRDPLTYLEKARTLPEYEGMNDRPTLHYLSDS